MIQSVRKLPGWRICTDRWVSRKKGCARRSNAPKHEWKMGEARLRDFLQGLYNDEHQHEGGVEDDKGGGRTVNGSLRRSICANALRGRKVRPKIVCN